MTSSNSLVTSTRWCDNNPALLTSLRNFHEQRARQPKNEITEATSTNTRYIGILEKQLKTLEKCSRIEYTGSSYEGVKVSNDIEFDIMVIIPVKSDEVNIEPDTQAGFSKLRVQRMKQQQPHLRDYLEVESLLLSPEKTTGVFLSMLQKCVDNNAEMKKRVILKRRPQTPAIEMNVYKNDKNSEEPWYFVDVVPTFEVDIKGSPNTKRCFVAKPGRMSSDYSWRVSFSLQEKALFDGIDRNNGCRKSCIRILKVLRNKEAGLQYITSYHMKTALFYLNGKPLEWKPMKMAERLFDLLTFIRDAAQRGVMPHYFMPQINLFDGVSAITLSNIANRLNKLITSEVQFNRAIDPNNAP